MLVDAKAGESFVDVLSLSSRGQAVPADDRPGEILFGK